MGQHLHAIATCFLMLFGCAPGLLDRWDLSGEAGQGNFFSCLLDLSDKEKPKAEMVSPAGQRINLAVCGLVERDGHVEFKMDIETLAQTCQEMKSPYLFIGDFGRDVIVGRVVDFQGREYGRFRAYRLK